MWDWNPTLRTGSSSRLNTTGEGAVDVVSTVGGVVGFLTQQPQQGIALHKSGHPVLGAKWMLQLSHIGSQL